MHTREVVLPDPLSEQARIQLEEEENPGKPTHRLWGKQSPPGSNHMKLPPLPRLDRGGSTWMIWILKRIWKKNLKSWKKNVGCLVVEKI